MKHAVSAIEAGLAFKLARVFHTPLFAEMNTSRAQLEVFIYEITCPQLLSKLYSQFTSKMVVAGSTRKEDCVCTIGIQAVRR